MALLLLNKGSENTQSYAPRKNLTHEPTVGGVQSTSGQYSILSAAVSDGDPRNRDVIQDGRFQFSRPVWVRSAYGAPFGG